MDPNRDWNQSMEQNFLGKVIFVLHVLNIRNNSKGIYQLIELCLKVLSSEMDPAEIRLIRWAFFKGIVASGF